MGKVLRLSLVFLALAAVGRLPAAPPEEQSPPALSLQPPRPPPPKPTPASPELTAYKKQVADVIGLRWYQTMKVQAPGKIEVGSVKIRFLLLPSGAIGSTKVISGKAKNPHLAKLSEAALRAAPIPPMLPAVIDSLTTPRKALVVDFSFINK